jgi:hypothetical protein
MRVFVYFNLHRKCLSIKALEGPNKGRVVAHEQAAYLTDVTFKVSEAGRQRVIREQRKNVHAGVVGHWEGPGSTAAAWAHGRAIGVTYNPYRFATFVERESLSPVRVASLAHINGRQITAWAAA